MRSIKNGFSLVELAIIITVIGLITASVIGGSAMIESAKINKFAGEIQTVKKAFHNFASIYGAKPGDFNAAQSHFGSSGVSNGDGNGIINQGDDDTSDEVNNAMVHLAKANMLETTGLANDADKFMALDSFKGEIYLSANRDADGAAISGFNYISGTHNFLIVADTGYGYNGFIKPLVAFKLDKKFDDSFPRTGKITYIVAGNVSDASCTNSSTKYFLTSKDLGCNISFSLD